jgi:hypothetical protein
VAVSWLAKEKYDLDSLTALLVKNVSSTTFKKLVSYIFLISSGSS